MSATLYRVTPRELRVFVEDVLQAGLVPNVVSSPGMGKSSIMRRVARDWNLKLIDIRLSTAAPEDMTGLPEFYNDPRTGQRKARFVPIDQFPLEFDELPEGKDGWLIFYDEANSATKMVQAASYKVTLDRMIGQSRLHENVAQAMAGNLMSDRAIVNQLSTAMQSRLVHFEMTISHPEWMEDVAYAEGYDERVIAYLNYADGHLMDFRPDHDDRTFCCPRTWEFMNRLVKGKAVTVDKTPLYAGTITSGVAAEFVGFCQLQKELVTVADVLRDPAGAEVPTGPDAAQRRWIVTSHLMGKANDENFRDICAYMARMDLSFRIQFFRSVQVRTPELRQHPSFAQAMVELSKHINPRK